MNDVCGQKVCWCRDGVSPQDRPNPAIGDPGRIHMEPKSGQVPPLEWPIFFIGLFALILLARLA
jgi:hypothetical protein